VPPILLGVKKGLFVALSEQTTLKKKSPNPVIFWQQGRFNVEKAPLIQLIVKTRQLPNLAGCVKPKISDVV